MEVTFLIKDINHIIIDLGVISTLALIIISIINLLVGYRDIFCFKVENMTSFK